MEEPKGTTTTIPPELRPISEDEASKHRPLEHVFVPARRRAGTAGDLELGGSRGQDSARGEEEASCSSLDVDIPLGSSDEEADRHDYDEDDNDDRDSAALDQQEIDEELPISRSTGGGRRRGRRRSWQAQYQGNDEADSSNDSNHNWRFMRGFLVLAVYSFLLLQPSSGPPPDVKESSALKESPQKGTDSLGNEPYMPRLTHKGSYYYSPPSAITHTATATTKSATSTAGTTTNAQQKPLRPSLPPQARQQQQQQNQPKRLLSHAHSYRLHQEPLVFGNTQKQQGSSSSSWFYNYSGDDEYFGFYPSSSLWGFSATHLIWLFLMSLVVDTCYREWQDYRLYRHCLRLSPRGSPRHRRYRTSPSPVPVRRPRRRRSNTNNF